MDQKIVEKLKELIFKMQNLEDLNEFEDLLSNYSHCQDEDTLKNLLSLFNDNCLIEDAMWSLVHLVEMWPREIYVKTILIDLDISVKYSMKWQDCLINRIFNVYEYLEVFKKNIHLADQESLFKLFDYMEKESPHHYDLIQELRKLRLEHQ